MIFVSILTQSHKMTTMFSLFLRCLAPLLLSLVSLSSMTALYPTELIYQFPNGTYLSNILVRPDNSILTVLISAPELYQVQPFARKPDPKLVYRFNGFTSLLSITEMSKDKYQIAACNRTGVGRAAPGSTALLTVKFRKRGQREPEYVRSSASSLRRMPRGGSKAQIRPLLHCRKRLISY